MTGPDLPKLSDRTLADTSWLPLAAASVNKGLIGAMNGDRLVRCRDAAAELARVLDTEILRRNAAAPPDQQPGHPILPPTAATS